MSAPAFKKSDLYIYDLPEVVLDSLQLNYYDSRLQQVPEPAASKNGNEEPKLVSKKLEVSNSLICGTCGISFEEQASKRQHYKTELHILNIKRALKKQPPILEQLESYSISDDDDDDGEVAPEGKEIAESDDNDSSDAEMTLQEDQIHYTKDSADENITSHLNTKSPYLYFTSNLLPEGEIFAIYKSVFDTGSLCKPLETLKTWKATEGYQSGKISALFMVAGGHFAGAIVSHQRINVKGNARKKNSSLQEQGVYFLEHKSFHRYTTRRKQGGSQSAMDNAKGKANSAGSSLRRYNEAALKVDIQNLFQEWAPYLEKCDNIYLRARSVQDRKIFTESGIISKDDARLKTFPFTTSRPTIGELRKAWCELTYAKIVNKPEILPPKKEMNLHIEQPKHAVVKEKVRKSEAEEQTDQLVQLVKKSRAPLLVSYLKKNKIDVDFKLQPSSKYAITPTMLHYASQQGLRQMVVILLTNLKCDPCILNSMNKTAWELAKNEQVRQSFQVARHTLGEGYTDWEKSKVGPPLSRDEVEKLNREREDLQSKEVKSAIEEELKLAKERQRQEVEKKRGPGRILGVSTEQQNLNSLSEDQRRKLMREQRARAAEARLRR